MEFVLQGEKNSLSGPPSMINSLDSFEFSVAGSGNYPDPALEKLLQLHRLSPNGSSNELAVSNAAQINAIPVNSEATSVTRKALPATIGHLFVGGATGKVGKKRSKASQRTPTTLLSTNISNFKAMVQQFTGLPESPCASQGPSLGRSLPDFTPPHCSPRFLIRDPINSAPFFLPGAPPHQGGHGQPFPVGGVELDPAPTSVLSRPGYLIEYNLL